MNKNINLLEILKGIPDGTKLWSPVCGECEVESIIHCDAYPIRATHGKGNETLFYKFTSQGKLCNNSEAECVLFPSKENRDWSTFTAPWKNKHFEPFQKVLIPGIMENVYYWSANFYSHYDKKHRVHYLIDGETINDDDYIIPYEGNEDKLGKQMD